jgi:hypothetical protein
VWLSLEDQQADVDDSRKRKRKHPHSRSLKIGGPSLASKGTIVEFNADEMFFFSPSVTTAV